MGCDLAMNDKAHINMDMFENEVHVLKSIK